MHKLIFESKRLSIRELSSSDQKQFVELLTAPEIINMIPQAAWPLSKVLAKFEMALNYPENPLSADQIFWAVSEKEEVDMIGLCFLIVNDQNQRELGYRLRKEFWGRGYATEVMKNAIDYCFEKLQLDLITADAWVKNKASIRILEKFMIPVKEFINPDDQCLDRRYELKRKDWTKKR
jgi:RimJ/RimL family protein N-acetyltransferase